MPDRQAMMGLEELLQRYPTEEAYRLWTQRNAQIPEKYSQGVENSPEQAFQRMQQDQPQLPPAVPSVGQLEQTVGRIGRPTRPVDIGALINPMGQITRQGDANLAARRKAQEEETARFRFNQTQGGQPY